MTSPPVRLGVHSLGNPPKGLPFLFGIDPAYSFIDIIQQIPEH